MTDITKEKISLLLDNELDTDEALRLLNTLLQQPDYMEKLNRYQIASQALKAEVFLPANSNFLTRVHNEIEQLPVYSKTPGRLSKPKIPRWSVQMMAVAASIWVIAIIMNSNSPEPAAPAMPTPSPLLVSAPVNTRVLDYVQTHEQTGISNGEAYSAVSF